DVGTGTGAIALLLAEAGHRVTGVDLSRGMLAVARRKARKMGLEVSFRLADAEALPFESGCFDGVVSRHLLWTLPDPEKALREWSRVTRRGGRVAVIDGRYSIDGVAGRVRRLLGQVGVLIFERRNPWNFYRKELRDRLPLVNGADGGEIAGLMSSCGIEGVSVRDLGYIRELQRKRMPWYHRLQSTYRTYMVWGTVPERGGA
ncbi:MAG: class I SAM-dependent methyltransferase, partial [Euryarchaeota archaeon]|nr:class I SAM-dependent methyltransferase [Euryarchaeota archaeon]